MKNPDIISLGELLVEIMRTEVDVPHGSTAELYRGPFPSGAPAIFIDSAARMAKPFNLNTGYIGVRGLDEFGDCIVSKLEQDGVDVSQIRISRNKTTGIAFNQYNSDGSRKFIFTAGAAGEICQNDVNEDYFSNIKALHIMGSALSISESSREACYKAINITRKVNPKAIISFDPNLRPEMLDIKTILEISKPVLDETNILLPSGEEAEMLAGIKGEKAACLNLIKKNPNIVVLKQGKEGASVFIKDQKEIHVPAFIVDEVDPTGAGDSFGGAFIVGYLQGWSLEYTLEFASATGALKVKHFGPMSNDSYAEVISLIN
ncbi:MAG: sugar kinase [Candidatus Lokiarchaeota archaeon]|nr:sugar kinase [Candidatus Lokiarchaeota archaeon]